MKFFGNELNTVSAFGVDSKKMEYGKNQKKHTWFLQASFLDECLHRSVRIRAKMFTIYHTSIYIYTQI